MKKIILGVLVIAFICITSGAYAFLSENATVSSVDNTNIVYNNIPVNTDDSVQVSSNPNIMPNSQQVNENDDMLVYVGSYAYYPKSEGVTDYYIKCVECGGYIPIGEVTTHLPDAALCHGFKGILSGDYKNFAVSYDDAYNTWVKYGMPVYDDGSNLSKWGDPIHQEVDDPDIYLVNTNSEIDMPLVDPTPCDNSITPESLNLA